MKIQKNIMFAETILFEGLENRRLLSATNVLVPVDPIVPIEATSSDDLVSINAPSTDDGNPSDPSLIFQSGISEGEINVDAGDISTDPGDIIFQSGLPDGAVFKTDDSLPPDGTDATVQTTDNSEEPVSTDDGTDTVDTGPVGPILDDNGNVIGPIIYTLGGPRSGDGPILPNQRNHTANAHNKHHGAWHGLNVGTNFAKSAHQRNVSIATKNHHTPTTANGGVNFNAVAKQSFTTNVGSFHANTVDIVFKAKIKWGDGTASKAVLTGGLGAGGDFQIAGTHTYARTGVYSVKINVTSALAGNSKLSHHFTTLKSVATVTA